MNNNPNTNNSNINIDININQNSYPFSNNPSVSHKRTKLSNSIHITPTTTSAGTATTATTDTKLTKPTQKDIIYTDNPLNNKRKIFLSQTMSTPQQQHQQLQQQHQQQQQQQQPQQHVPQQPVTQPVPQQAPPPPPQQQQQQQQPIYTEEEQILISNLQETYKSILRLEVETQKGCAQLNQKLIENNTGVEFNNELWSVYKNVTQLLDHYYDFLLYALSPSSNKRGKPLVANYRILKRMYVYGVAAFLEVLKNVISVFMDHEICACFISYSFNIISCLIDPELGIESWWAEKLGELSRIAISLYPAKFMDWKMAAIFWYQESIKTQFGHGKIYYHMCSVENDNLEALMLIGKGVNCRDPFVPTQQYLRMIVDNVSSQRNILSPIEMSMIDFVKIHKILLLPTYNINNEMINFVSNYGSNFGIDNSTLNYFHIRSNNNSISDINQKIQFWYQKSPNFTLSNIYHLIGFGSCNNPFAKLFDLPNAIKERKERKEKREKRRRSRSNSSSSFLDQQSQQSKLSPNDPDFLINSTASDLSEDYWFLLLDNINKGVIELSMKIFQQFLSGPIQSSTPQSIIWLYFIISINESIEIYPTAKLMFVHLLKLIIPWNSLTCYLNDILTIVRSVPETNKSYSNLLSLLTNSKSSNPKLLLNLFSNNETLSEVWKCWGSLWFDRISLKEDYTNVFESGIKNNIFDIPLTGEIYKSFEDGERYIRILLLANYIIENLPELGLIRSNNIFKYSKSSNHTDSLQLSEKNNQLLENFKSDIRIQNLFKFHEMANIIDTSNERLIYNDHVNNSIFVDNFQLNDWINEKKFPNLPNWETNSFGFMTDFVNNQYPAILTSKSYLKSSVSSRVNEDDDDNEYEDDSEDYEEEYEDDEDEEDDHEESNNAGDVNIKKSGIKNDNEYEEYNYNIHEQYELTSEGESIGTNAPTSAHYTTLSEIDKNEHIKKLKIIKGDIGDFMDTSITFISMDTNVWLKHCGRIFKCVRSRIFKLAIPLTVFQELRSLRKSNDSLVAESATRAVIIARQLYSENVVLAIRSDGTTASHINETREFEHNENWRINSDDLILKSIKLNDSFGKNLNLGYGYSIGELPKFPIFEEPNKIAGFFNGSYRGGYSTSSFPTTLQPTPNTENSVTVYGSSNIDSTSLRGDLLRPKFIASKSVTLSKPQASVFRYNILVSDDHEMASRANSIDLKYFRSSEWFSIVDKLSMGRCYD